MNWFVILFYGKVIYGRDVFVFRQYEHFSLHLVAVGYGQPCHNSFPANGRVLPVSQKLRIVTLILPG
jgi:hypothetical protein